MIATVPRRERPPGGARRATSGTPRRGRSPRFPWYLPLGAISLGACAFIEQYPDPAPDPVTTTATSSSSSSSGAGGGQGGSGGGTTTSSTTTSGGGGAGGSGGAGGAGASSTGTTTGSAGGGGTGGGGGSGGCVPASTQPCYTGPPETRGVGACKDGVSTCSPQGEYGPCQGDLLPSPEDCAAPADEDCDGLSPPCPVGATLWAKRFGDASDQTGSSIAADKDGNVVLAGAFAGLVDFGGGAMQALGAQDAYVVKLGPTGEHAWSKRFGNEGTEACSGVAVDGAGAVTIAGQYNNIVNFGQGPLQATGQNDVFIARFTAAGGIVWGNGYGDPFNQLCNAVATNAQGDLLVGGRIDGTIDFGIGALTSVGLGDIFAARFSPQGTPLWTQRFGDPQLQVATATALDAAGNMFVAGAFKGKLDFGLGPSPNALAVSLFLVKFDPAGNVLWNKWFPGAFSVLFSRNLATDAAGNVVIFGRLNGSADFGGGMKSSLGLTDNLFAAKLDPAGNHLWSKVWGGGGVTFDGGVAVDPFGNIVLTGGFETALALGGPMMVSAGAEDLFVAKLDPKGNHLWSQRYGDAMVQSGRGVATGGDGQVFVTGLLTGTIDFGQGPVTSAGGQDILLLSLSP